MAVELRLPCLCLVADCSVVGPGELPARVAAAVEGGVNLVQLRAKEMPGGRLLSLARELKRLSGQRAVLLINERVDVAVAACADGVQLGEEALPIPAASGLLSPGSLIGRSVHSVDGAVNATEGGADLLVVGTMFATDSHPGAEPAGPPLVRDVASRCSLPLIGIGGITPGNLDAVIAAGASGVAVIRSILAADDPAAASREMLSSLQASWREHRALSDNGVQIETGRPT